MTNLLTILRTQFVLINRQPSCANEFDAVEPLYGMQGVRRSSLLGSISKRTQSTSDVFGGLKGPLFDAMRLVNTFRAQKRAQKIELLQ